MPRAAYIYLIRDANKDVVSAHTVKHEAHTWRDRSGKDGLKLSAIRDGVFNGKTERPVDWDEVEHTP